MPLPVHTTSQHPPIHPPKDFGPCVTIHSSPANGLACCGRLIPSQGRKKRLISIPRAAELTRARYSTSLVVWCLVAVCNFFAPSYRCLDFLVTAAHLIALFALSNYRCLRRVSSLFAAHPVAPFQFFVSCHHPFLPFSLFRACVLALKHKVQYLSNLVVVDFPLAGSSVALL
jgi:hypothetical protein